MGTFPLVALVLFIAAPAGAELPRVDERVLPPRSPENLPVAPRTLTVSGEGRVSVKPDIAVVSAGAQAIGKDLAPTVADVNGRVHKILGELARIGVPESDIQTTRHDISVDRPWKEGRPGPITGYAVTDTLAIRVRSLDRLPAVLDGVVAAGANEVFGVSLQKEDSEAAEREALTRAIVAARGKAEAMAKAAGVSLSGPISISEAAREGPVPMGMANMRAAPVDAGVAVAAGELEVAASVEMVFSIR